MFGMVTFDYISVLSLTEGPINACNFRSFGVPNQSESGSESSSNH